MNILKLLTIMSKLIIKTNAKLIPKIIPEAFSYVKLFADTAKPEHFLVNTIIADQWLDELKIFNETSSELSTEKYNNRPIINHVLSNMSNGFKILYLQILTGDIPIFNSIDVQLEYLLILNKMTSKEKIKIFMENAKYDNELWKRILDLNINFKDFLPEDYKVVACHECIMDPNMKGKERNIVDFYGLKQLSDFKIGGKYWKYIPNNEMFSGNSDRTKFRVFDNTNKIIYQVIGVGPLTETVVKTLTDVATGSKPHKIKRSPSAYNLFMKEELARLKEENHKLTHKEAWTIATKNHVTFKKNGFKRLFPECYLLFNPQPFDFLPKQKINRDDNIERLALEFVVDEYEFYYEIVETVDTYQIINISQIYNMSPKPNKKNSRDSYSESEYESDSE